MLGTMRFTVSLLAALTLAFPATAQTAGPYIPKAVELPGMTGPETAANDTWRLRGALNVAALQCQFSPFLRSVVRYNSLIKQHGKEFARAQATLLGYFKRTGAAASGFDRYNTRLYQSYSTFDAQIPFCRAASDAARDALVQPIGKLAVIARAEVAAVRGALTPVDTAMSAMAYGMLGDAVTVPGCVPDRRGRC